MDFIVFFKRSFRLTEKLSRKYRVCICPLFPPQTSPQATPQWCYTLYSTRNTYYNQGTFCCGSLQGIPHSQSSWMKVSQLSYVVVNVSFIIWKERMGRSENYCTKVPELRGLLLAFLLQSFMKESFNELNSGFFQERL
jgi:hypothetical protein